MWVRIALTIIILAGLALRVAHPGVTTFCRDQVRACALAQDIAEGYWQTGGLINSGHFRNPPGFGYLLAAVWRVLPDPLALVYFTSCINVLAVLASGILLRRWVGSSAAWWATAFLAASPWSIQYSRWIWAQDLLFPGALLVYYFLWKWAALGRQWAAMGVVLALALLVQVHLSSVVLVLAIGFYLLWCRPKLPWVPILLGAAIAIAAFVPYLIDGHLAAPTGNRTGYRHFWRVMPAAAMSLSGIGWQLEFREGYPVFAAALGWRRWPYEIVMLLPVVLLARGLTAGVLTMFRERSVGMQQRRSPATMVVALVVLIPLSFVLLGLRTSPTYLPLWYPLPFAVLGGAAARLVAPDDQRRLSRLPGHLGNGSRARPLFALLLIAVLLVELAFFVEQLRFIDRNGGVPQSVLARHYHGTLEDVAAMASRVDAAEVWLAYAGPSDYQDEPAAYLFRRAAWAGAAPRRAVIHFAFWRGPYDDAALIEYLPDGADPPEGAYLIRPWEGPQQVGSKVPLRP